MNESGNNSKKLILTDDSTQPTLDLHIVQRILQFYANILYLSDNRRKQNPLTRHISTPGNSCSSDIQVNTSQPLITTSPAAFPSTFDPTVYSQSNDSVSVQALNCLFSNIANASTNFAATATTTPSGAALIPLGPSQLTSSTPIVGSASAHNNESLSSSTMNEQPLDLSMPSPAISNASPSSLTVVAASIAQSRHEKCAELFSLPKDASLPFTSSAIGSSQDVSNQRNIALNHFFAVKADSAATQDVYKWSESEQRPPRKRRRVCDKPRSQNCCNICDAKFVSKPELNFHMVKSHGGWKCSICGSQFTQRGNLDRHMLIHLNKKAFMCVICEAKFIRRDHLTRHGREKHVEFSPEVHILRIFRSSKYIELLKTMPPEEVSQIIASDMEGTSVDENTNSLNDNSDCLKLGNNEP